MSYIPIDKNKFTTSTSDTDLRNEFFRLSKIFEDTYQEYLTLKSVPTPDQVAVNKKLTDLNKVNEDLTYIIGQINVKAGTTSNALLTASQSIENYTRQIYEKSGDLQRQQNELIRKKDELHSKQKQVEMGVQKNRYRRNLIVILTILNIIMIGIIYYFYNKSGSGVASE